MSKSKYTEDFKKEVGEATFEEGMSLAKVGEKYNVHPTLVRNWRIKYCSDRLSADETKEIDEQLEMKLYYGHLFCHVLHQNYIFKKGVDAEGLKEELLKTYEDKGAEYPAEHNVGHEYLAKPTLSKFYKELDPTNSFNPGIGKTSKRKGWE